MKVLRKLIFNRRNRMACMMMKKMTQAVRVAYAAPRMPKSMIKNHVRTSSRVVKRRMMMKLILGLPMESRMVPKRRLKGVSRQ